MRRRAAQLREQGEDIRAMAEQLVTHSDEIDWAGRAADAMRRPGPRTRRPPARRRPGPRHRRRLPREAPGRVRPAHRHHRRRRSAGPPPWSPTPVPASPGCRRPSRSRTPVTPPRCGRPDPRGPGAGRLHPSARGPQGLARRRAPGPLRWSTVDLGHPARAAHRPPRGAAATAAADPARAAPRRRAGRAARRCRSTPARRRPPRRPSEDRLGETRGSTEDAAYAAALGGLHDPAGSL